MKAKCPECDRVFDLMDEADAEEFYYGHDCEPTERDWDAYNDDQKLVF